MSFSSAVHDRSASVVEGVAAPADAVQRVRYALITPVRDEEAYIGAMIPSIAAQTVPPTQWIIVDDGSRDRTVEIIREYAQRCSFIELLCLPPRTCRLAGGEGAIPNALRQLDLREFDYLARFDADLIFPRDYIERILGEFDRDPSLGIAGGGLYVEQHGGLVLEKNPDTHVRGALKMYRRQCLLEIGGLTTAVGWDTIDEICATSKGWTTHSFPSLQVIHRRPTGRGIAGGRVYLQRGRAEYMTWSHPLHVMARTIRVAVLERSVIRPLCYLAGFIESYLRRTKRMHDPAFLQARRAYEKQRVAAAFALSRGMRETTAASGPQKRTAQ